MEDYRNIICPSCGGKIWEHGNSAFHCQRLRRNVCAACCRVCRYNREWRCEYGMKRKSRRMGHQAAAEKILASLRQAKEQKAKEKGPADGESDGPNAANVQQKSSKTL